MLKPIKRAVHFDFHTMPGIHDIGRCFDADVFATIRMLEGDEKVKTMEGWFT